MGGYTCTVSVHKSFFLILFREKIEGVTWNELCMTAGLLFNTQKDTTWQTGMLLLNCIAKMFVYESTIIVLTT